MTGSLAMVVVGAAAAVAAAGFWAVTSLAGEAGTFADAAGSLPAPVAPPPPIDAGSAPIACCRCPSATTVKWSPLSSMLN